MSKITLHTHKTESVFTEAAELLLKSIDEKLKSGNKVLLLLSGGSAVRIYEGIKNLEFRIKNLAIGQADERFQPESDNPISNENINATQIEKTGLWEACKKKNIPYYLISQEGILEEAAEKYDQTISKLFKEYTYKIGVLGIGEDTHTAGLIPGYEKVWNIEKYVIGYDLRQNSPRGEFCRGGFPFRISLTPKALLMLDQALVVASGEKKKEVIRKVLDPENTQKIDKYPAVLIHKIRKVDLFTDNSL